MFPTKQRVPFLIFFETVSVEDCGKHDPLWERDFDFLRCQYNILSSEKFPDQIKEDINPTKTQETRKFKDLKKYLAAEKSLIDKNITDDKFRFVKKAGYLSKSAEVRRKKFRRKPRNNQDNMGPKKGLYNLSESEIMNRINFILLLLKYSKSRGLTKLNIEYLEKLKEILSVLKLKKTKRQTLTLNTDFDHQEKVKQIRKESPYEKFESYKLRGYILKAGDDMRQESVIIHFINIIGAILRRENCSVFIMELDFILLSKTAAMIEWIPNSSSINSLKKIYNEKNLHVIFKTMFTRNFEEAQKNFVESLAGYSLLCYLFQIKDRHNSNILIDSDGHVAHIDFGFCLSATPGSIGFETAPFKFTQEYVDIVGGFESPMFYYFKILLFKAFEVLKKFSEEIWGLMDIMQYAELPCFYKFDIQAFKNRFHRFYSETEREKLVNDLTMNSFGSKRTVLYDQFQKYTNDIEM